MHTPNDLNQSRVVLKQDSTLIAVIEMSLSCWLVAGLVPGVERQPSKKLAVDESALLKLLNRWREEAEKAGHKIDRIAVAFEAGRDGFWLARWLRARGIEAHVIHASSVAVSREHRRAKTDRLDTENVITARWSQYRQFRTKMPSGRTASARVSSESKLGSSTA
jgi:transposase